MMFETHLLRRILKLSPTLAFVLVLCTLVTPAGAQSSDQTDSNDVPLQTLDSPSWTLAINTATLRSRPDEAAEAFGNVRPLAPLQVLGYAGDWAYVYNPRTKGTAYVHSDQIGPGDAPSEYASADPPAVEEELDRRGWVENDTPVSFVPTGDPAAAYTELTSGTAVQITGSVHDEDGTEWYRTAYDDYIPASAVAFPAAPAAPSFVTAPGRPPRTFAGAWIDVNLSQPAHLTTYQGDTPQRSMLTIIGRGPMATPTGTFSIIRRVANETMDSSTVGIPRNSAGGYYLTNVLYTQYFLPGGQSIHYNYWSSNWGYPGSHGCLGLSYSDAAYVWGFASIGTPVSVHY